MTVFVGSFNCLISFKVENQSKSNQIKQLILLHAFYKFWYTLGKIKWLNIYNGKSCVGRRFVRKSYISQDHIMQR